jgi:hypothetical protein
LAYLCDTNDQNENDRDQELADVGSFGTPLQVIATPTNDNGDTDQRQWRHHCQNMNVASSITKSLARSIPEEEDSS